MAGSPVVIRLASTAHKEGYSKSVTHGILGFTSPQTRPEEEHTSEHFVPGYMVAVDHEAFCAASLKGAFCKTQAS